MTNLFGQFLYDVVPLLPLRLLLHLPPLPLLSQAVSLVGRQRQTGLSLGQSLLSRPPLGLGPFKLLAELGGLVLEVGVLFLKGLQSGKRETGNA